jgi:hypothetical protein
MMMRRFFQLFLLIAFSVAPRSIVQAEEQNDISKTVSEYSFNSVARPKPSEQAQISEAVQLEVIKINRHYVMITAGLLAFSLVIITFLMKITPHQARDLVSIIGLVSVVFGSILTVLVVDTHEALTAPMGIFGAIAGYLFGTAQKKEVERSMTHKAVAAGEVADDDRQRKA